jgi:hypothetical protein
MVFLHDHYYMYSSQYTRLFYLSNNRILRNFLYPVILIRCNKILKKIHNTVTKFYTSDRQVQEILRIFSMLNVGSMRRKKKFYLLQTKFYKCSYLGRENAGLGCELCGSHSVAVGLNLRTYKLDKYYSIYRHWLCKITILHILTIFFICLSANF